MVKCVRHPGSGDHNPVSYSVASVSRSGKHTFSKNNEPEITLIKGIGVEGDAHSGVTVRHRSLAAFDPERPNLRQVHLIHEELFAELELDGYNVSAGDIGENITTRGLDLLELPKGTVLIIGKDAKVQITGLREPCRQLDIFRNGLMSAVLGKNEDGSIRRKTGVMGIVLEGGIVKPGDRIEVELPDLPHQKLDVV